MRRLYDFFAEKYNDSSNRALLNKIFFIALSVSATLWFLIRVIPKPSRATYPCMQAAAPIMSSFVIWLISLGGAALSYKKAGAMLRRKRYGLAFALMGMCVLCTGIFMTRNSGYIIAQTPRTKAVLHVGPNQPIGVGKGIFPGRVVWSHAPGAASWDEATGFWFEDRWNDQAKADQLVKTSVASLAGKDTPTEGWNALFGHFNSEKGKGSVSYKKGEKIVIKINTNNTTSHSDSEELNTSPHLCLALLRSLVYDGGVAQEDITVCEPSRFITDYLFNKCVAEFPNVIYADFEGGNGRVKVEYIENAIPYSAGGEKAKGLAKCIVEADYLINCSLLKIHVGPGVTLTAKNWYGATDIDKNWRNNTHNHINQDRGGKHKYSTLVDYIGHKDLGGNTMLYIIDGMYGSRDVNGKPFPKWNMEPFNGGWACSVIISQDPLAVDAVGLDLLSSEWPEVESLSYCDAYLLEAASIPNAPSGTVYDPEQDGKPLLSPLGVLEHWNNPKERQYSRNLGKNEGIELVYKKVN